MNRSTPGPPIHHQLPEFTQTHVHRVRDAIQPSHPLSSPSPPALNLSQHQGLFQWVSSSHEVATVLEFELQHQSFQWTLRSEVKSLRCVRLFTTPWIAACQASLSITNSQSSLRFTSIESVMPSSHLILCRPLLLLPPIPPASESFPVSQLFAWGGQSTGVSASFLPKKSQGWSPSEWTGWISLESKGLSRVFSNTTVDSTK